MKRSIIVLCVLLLACNVYAQKKTVLKDTPADVKEKKDSVVVKNSLKLISRVGDKSVKLRWALTRPLGWKECNRYGFKVERYTLVRDTTWLLVPELHVLADPLLARPLEEWETLAKQDNYAAIMAQTLYGKTMQVDITDKNPVTQIVNDINDLEQRYSLSMMAGDMSFEAAKMAAWGFEDLSVKKNERYLYRIIPLAPVTQITIDSAFVLVRMEEYKPLPAPSKPDIVFSDSAATIGYNYFLLRDTYTAFHVERSMDKGKTFQQISKTPVAGLNEKKTQEGYRFYFTDKLQDNTTEYMYRIKGITSFSEIGPVSPSVRGKGISSVTAFPHITSSILNAEGHAELKWEFDDVNVKNIKGFDLNHSTRNEGPYTVVRANISPLDRKLVYKKLENSNYFSLTAVGVNGTRNTSPKRFLQLIDSIPPAPPIVKSAIVDSLGKVKVEWEANTEIDLLGYKLFRANNLTEEAYPITDSVFYQTATEDQLDPSMINRKIYYYVMALDKHYNESNFSKPAIVVRPDVTPPTAPIFKAYEITAEGVFLQWARCEDEDVAKHILIRKETTLNAVWITLAQFNDKTSSYTDKTAEAGKSYWYAILAKDESGLESVPLPPIKLKLPNNPDLVKVTLFKALPDVEGNKVAITWETYRTDIDHFELYKGNEEEPVTLWKVLDSKQRNITDNIKLNYKYEYMIRIVLKNGSTGVYSTVRF